MNSTRVKYPSALGDRQRRVRVSRGIIRHEILMHRCARRVELDALEVVFDPRVVHVFDTVYDWTASQSNRVLVRVRVWNDKPRRYIDIQGEAWIGGHPVGREDEVAFLKGCGWWRWCQLLRISCWILSFMVRRNGRITYLPVLGPCWNPEANADLR